MLAVVIPQQRSAGLPQTVPIPRAPGTSVFVYSRASNPASAPNRVTFEPLFYTVYHRDRQRIVLALRCTGTGTVLISAGEDYLFTCSDTEGVQRRVSASESSSPFLILGRTTGNVVWSLRIALDPARSGS